MTRNRRSSLQTGPLASIYQLIGGIGEGNKASEMRTGELC